MKFTSGKLEGQRYTMCDLMYAHQSINCFLAFGKAQIVHGCKKPEVESVPALVATINIRPETGLSSMWLEYNGTDEDMADFRSCKSKEDIRKMLLQKVATILASEPDRLEVLLRNTLSNGFEQGKIFKQEEIKGALGIHD